MALDGHLNFDMTST